VIPLIIGVKDKKHSIQKFGAKEDWNKGLLQASRWALLPSSRFN
jgi:hypothetical protein